MGSNPQEFHEQSYARHEDHFKDYALGGDRESRAKTWFEKDTVDAWRHHRIYNFLDPIIAALPGARWLTVGDGRYGNDAKYLLDKGCDVLATDISDALLKEAKARGFIPDYRKENAESLSFRDAEFDYVLCKESYHHCPRPMLALYEILRVAKKGVCLIEPNDAYVNSNFTQSILRNLKNLAKVLLRKTPVSEAFSKHAFEESGNYIFIISKREIEKVALGLNYKVVAFKGYNDAYFDGVENEKLADNGPLQRKVRRLIYLADMLCKMGLMDYANLVAIIFKQKPSDALLQGLLKEGYEIATLPNNPYISD